VSYELTPHARAQLLDIIRYRDEVAGPQNAIALDQRFRDLFDLIGTFGVPGSPRPDLLPEPYRVAVNDTYLVIWRPSAGDPSHRLITDIVDGRRDLGRVLADRMDD
jgi:plasmid stabilization system protein ParE